MVSEKQSLGPLIDLYNDTINKTKKSIHYTIINSPIKEVKLKKEGEIQDVVNDINNLDYSEYISENIIFRDNKGGGKKHKSKTMKRRKRRNITLQK